MDRKPKLGSKLAPGGPRSTELQELLALHGLSELVPADAWNIRNSAEQIRENNNDPVTINNSNLQTIIVSTPSPSIKSSDLQELLQSHGLRLETPEAPWNIRASAEKFRNRAKKPAGGGAEPAIKLSELQELFESHGLTGPVQQPGQPWT